MSSKWRSGRGVDAVADNIETLTGQRGDGSSRAVTYADLASLGLANLRTLGGKLKLTPSTGGSGESSNGKVQTPTKPTNFKATGGFAHVLLEWDMPQYSGRSLTEIYRSPEDNLANAVLIASTAAGVYGDPVDPEWKGYYWIRHVNSLGKPGPYNDSSGTYAETHADPTSIIDVINEQLNNSPLIEEMSGKIEENASAVQTNTQAIADLDGVKAMWSTRAQAGDITAGIGIVASTDSNGNTISQVAIAAGQVFIFDPNNPNDDGTYAIPFAVVDGKVVLDELVAKEAVIKILAAQTIMADSVKVGIEIVSPYIKTAKIESGGFTVDELGNATFGQLVSISAAGQISIKSNTDNVGLNITNNEIILRDENNINRIEIGL